MVKAHQAHTKGFTLAELLLSVAILLVLAALAFPSIVSAQNNMRMVELNNAAESIANAAQSQMTAKKVSGAWWSLVESEGLAQTKAVNLPSTINGRPTDAQNTFYITADQARKSSIVPPLAVDDSVRRGISS
ncbi:prepilin-type N-terminal cleavage/methylation domain-containing protein [Paraeggerthella hominis]|uniref:prepilin-type N-terminal cleavage/methylation domain-containing protein n=1 Tax=Paraeggerthella hominis TaxID=2897351 RepID=UPI003D0B79D1